MVSFANEQLRAGHNAIEAALEAGATRLRPVLMTALAMIVGMLPMAIGLAKAAAERAAGRAVIGGLLLATFATLFFVPMVFSFMKRHGYRVPQYELTGRRSHPRRETHGRRRPKKENQNG